ncbi:DUF4190 domain-containing protein [Arthrobacter sp. H14-L1]|uniref:DUF4190 domain-containing protein n=1 Tax=Arthrobacter sp. H14-L1 TaxID=2996697 RepID=UPI00226EE9B7|nr:DUF4190 domain-containing protein [Arthrobacter sp. H14-L1]MCY0905238.1 DUF4190 domain-containing protein [Arthrobacter sp. H14-L1]
MTDSNPQQPTPYGQESAKSDQPTPAFGQFAPPPYQQAAPPAYGAQPPAPYGQQPQQSYQGATVQDPGKTLGIIGLVLAFLISIAGLVVSIIALQKSKAAGFKNTPAKVGIFVSIIVSVLWIAGIIIVAIALVNLTNELQDACGNGQPTFVFNGVQQACPAVKQ